MTQIDRFTPDSSVEYVKIHGLQRTATNYMAHFVNQNFENTKALVNIAGWKHGHYCAPWVIGQEVHVISIVKNPYAWLVSLYNYWKKKDQPVGPDLSNITFDEFVRNPAIFEQKAGTPFLLRASNPVQHWNDMNFHWTSIKINSKQLVVVPFEGLLGSPQGTTEHIARYLGVKQKAFSNTNKVILPSDETPIESEEIFNRKHYANKLYMKEFAPELLKFVNKELDQELMTNLGYAIEH